MLRRIRIASRRRHRDDRLPPKSAPERARSEKLPYYEKTVRRIGRVREYNSGKSRTFLEE